jgi:molybdopterin-guanine dinucleotide biosynthesis adapter protein
VTGWKNSGKTTLVERLVSNLSARGLTVSTIKHAHHDFDVDQEGRDSWRHRKAGAFETAISSGVRWVLMHELRSEPEPSIDEILARMAPCDLILVEGYKQEPFDKIELLPRDSEARDPVWKTQSGVVAVAGELVPDDCPLPAFHPDAIGEIADFICAHLKLTTSGMAANAR